LFQPRSELTNTDAKAEASSPPSPTPHTQLCRLIAQTSGLLTGKMFSLHATERLFVISVLIPLQPPRSLPVPSNPLYHLCALFSVAILHSLLSLPSKLNTPNYDPLKRLGNLTVQTNFMDMNMEVFSQTR